MNREQMTEAMLVAFNNVVTPYVERGWVDPTNFDSLTEFANKSILGKTSPSFDYKDTFIGVDFECAVGSKVGSPTSKRYITVYYKDLKQGKYYYERFTRKELLRMAYKNLNKANFTEQLVLYLT